MPVNSEIAREKLILAGEKLIAEKGVEALSMRQVNLAAGQKNTSAALYHFGDKQGLVLAIFDYRMGNVNQRRHELLDQNSDSVRALLKAWLLPDIEEITGTEGGSSHARFLAVVTTYPHIDLNQLALRPAASSYMRVFEGLRELLPDLPPDVFAMRFGMAMSQSIQAMADQERARMAISSPLFISHLTDIMEAILTAPVSAETQLELDRTSQQQA